MSKFLSNLFILWLTLFSTLVCAQTVTIQAPANDEINLSGSITITIDYADITAEYELSVALKDDSWGWVSGNSENVSGTGSTSITIDIPSNLTENSNYIIHAELLESRDPWKKLTEDDITVQAVDLGSSSTTPAVNIDSPETVPVNGSFDVTVSYENIPEEYELSVALKDNSWSWVAGNSQVVSGTGTATVTIILQSSLTLNTDYIIHVELLESRDPWIVLTEHNTEVLSNPEGTTLSFKSPEKLPLSGSFDVTFDYTNIEEGLEYYVSLKKNDWTFITGTYAPATAGTGSATVTIENPEVLTASTEYIIQIETLSSRDPWVKEIEIYETVMSTDREFTGETAISLEFPGVIPNQGGFLMNIHQNFVNNPMKGVISLVDGNGKLVRIKNTYLGGSSSSPKFYMDYPQSEISPGNYTVKAVFTNDDTTIEMNETITVEEATATFTPYAGGFYIEDGKLYDENGLPFVMRGVNNMHVYWDNNDRLLAYNSLDAIAAHGANTIRIVWLKETSNIEAAFLWDIVERVIELNMIPVIELQDVTGNSSSGDLLEMANYWAEYTEEINKYGKHLIVNIANEWGGGSIAMTTWYTTYMQAVTSMRSAGIQTTIMIDGNNWGQSIEGIKRYGKQLLLDDPLENLLFSVHMYCDWADDEYIRSQLSFASEYKYPLVVGEFGFQHPSSGDDICTINADLIMEKCEDLGIGYIAWAWSGNGSEVAFLDMADWNNDQKLSDWGIQIIEGENGITATAQAASLFGGVTSIEESISKEGIALYPMPVVRGQAMQFELENTKAEIWIEVLNEAGYKVYETSYQYIQQGTLNLDLEAGYYFLKIHTGTNTVIKRVVVL